MTLSEEIRLFFIVLHNTTPALHVTFICKAHEEAFRFGDSSVSPVTK